MPNDNYRVLAAVGEDQTAATPEPDAVPDATIQEVEAIASTEVPPTLVSDASADDEVADATPCSGRWRWFRDR